LSLLPSSITFSFVPAQGETMVKAIDHVSL
jgi:hypothetical protein